MSVEGRVGMFKWLPWLLVVVLTLFIIQKYWFQKAPAKQENYHQMVVEKIESLGKLEVVKYSFRDVLEHKRNKSVWGVNFPSKTLLIIGAEAVACIDLTKVSVADIDTSAGKLKVRLPQPEICYVKVDHERSKVYNTEMSIFDDAESGLIDEAYREAESYIRAEVDKTAILQNARTNTVKLLVPLLETISNRELTIEFKEP
jgi:hypothetical protein